MAKKMRCGDIRVEMEEEEILWMDRKRVTVFALPWSFTKYHLTPTKLVVESGFLNTQEDEIRLYRVRDIAYSQSFLERIAGTGTLTIVSNDSSLPQAKLVHIKNARKVKEVISQTVELARRASGVRTSELMAGHEYADECSETPCECGEQDADEIADEPIH